MPARAGIVGEGRVGRPARKHDPRADAKRLQLQRQRLSEGAAARRPATSEGWRRGPSGVGSGAID
jgi:hypothetical protein